MMRPRSKHPLKKGCVYSLAAQEHSGTVADHETGAYYMNDLAAQNEATMCTVDEPMQLGMEP
jgi:hypothetical protein